MPSPNDRDMNDFDSFDTDTTDDVALPGAAGDDGEVQLSTGADIDVDVVDDVPERDRNARPMQRPVEEPTDDELAQYSQGVQRRIKDLTHARHDERRKREALEREHQASVQLVRAMQAENARLAKIVQDGSKQFGEMSAAAADAKLADARRALKEANESFDTDKIVAAQEQLAEALHVSREAKNFKLPVVQSQEDVVQTATSQPTASAAQLDPKTSAWMQKNRWFTAPEHVAATSYALGLDKELRDSGYDPRTDEYFEQVDARMKKRFPELYSGESQTADDARSQRPQQRDRGSAVAPAVRTTSKRRVTLSASQVALCTKLGITPQQYAAELIASGDLK